MKKIIFASISLALITFNALGHQYTYSNLVIRDYDEMSKSVTQHVKKARKLGEDSGSIEELREALKLIFSRPNSDNMVAKLTPEVRRELTGFGAYEDTIMSLTNEAISAVTSDSLGTVRQATYLFMLENILSEIRPESQTNLELRKAIHKIRDAKIKVSAEVRKERKLRSMYPAFEPSSEAQKALDQFKKK